MITFYILLDETISESDHVIYFFEHGIDFGVPKTRDFDDDQGNYIIFNLSNKKVRLSL